MLVFPQLATGAAALYPVTRRAHTRTVENVLGDERRVTYSDPDGAFQEWELRATGLAEAEWNAIEALFDAAAGRLTTFTLLDPAGNLLAGSEEFGDPVWTNGPLIQLTPGISDPFGSTRATGVVNAAQAAEAVAQTLAVPGNYGYSLSAWARSAGGANVTLFASTTGGSATRDFAAGTQWQRVSMFVDLSQNTASVTFGAQLAAGAAVDLFGMQVEAQPGVSDYKRTGAQGGVYSRARFTADELTVRAQGTDQFDAVIRIVSVGN
jgi:hypothetical protein